MRKIGNTLYITLPDVYLSLDGENVVILNQQKVIKRIPLHNLSSIVMFNYQGISPALMGKCMSQNITPVSYTHLDVYKRQMLFLF